jgi:hypothetical protein
VTLTSAKITTVLQTGDKFIRDDAFMFLKDLLPLWKGIWHQSTLEMLLSNDSVIDRLVKLSQCINTLEERSVIDRIQILFHKALQYQYYLRILDEVKHNAENLNIKRKHGVGNATFILDYLLKHLYLNDWDLISPTEKPTRRDRLHWQKRFGSYGTRNIVVIGMMVFLERPTECLLLSPDLSKFYSSGVPLFLGDSPSPVFTAVVEKTHVRHGANK